MFIGSWLSGLVVDALAASGTSIHDWRAIWLVPAGAAALVLALFATLFNAPRRA
jgi:Nucleoside H+ symporter